jgi:Xaa-Pro aminopeptidase
MQSRPFSDDEYTTRRQRAAAAAAGAGLDALLVCSRGGGTSDRHGNLVYLCNAYTAFPFIPDNPPLWSGRGHAFLLVPAAGEAELVLDVQYGEFDQIALDRVRIRPDVIPAVAGLLRERGLERGRVGLVGSDVLPVRWYWDLAAALPGVEWIPADDLLDDQRMTKSAAEQQLLREVARRGVRVMHAVLDAARPGSTKGEVMGAGLAAMARDGLLPYDLRLGSGTDLRRAFLAHLPGADYDERLAAGELLRVDIVASWHGYYVDFARTCIVGGQAATGAQRTLLRAAHDAVYAVIDGIRPGVTGRELTELGQAVLRRHGLIGGPDEGSSRASGFAGFGHGIGVAWERPWLDEQSALPLAPGMCLAVEKKVGIDGVGAATFEEMVLVTATGAEVLTAGARYAAVS